ncbi:MAG TPA: FAD-linked oxidase C-terminal domain-containing protein [Verrucomicrobiota bacterium]|nr:FAD-linked oxidase C-terminal domain-containing protein [Verrucomicrobiota bacterium]HNU52360.1 FAD-linked oxidase C-terminal domain-containing protein [Verrucomicrobiota bacterium]
MRAALERLQEELEAGDLLLGEAVRRACAGDKWYASRMPEAVARPRTTRAVSRILEGAHRHRIPVTPRGGGHGYVGGCVPVAGGVVLDLSRMRRIVEIHEGDFVAVVQPGVVTDRLQAAVEARGLFYPPDPASRSDCTLGGNIATNAGGPRCLKYGVTRDYVLGLEVALADGTVARLGSRTHKNKTGFDLARFFVGSEGLLGVITEATLKLLPRPPYRSALSAGFPSTASAVRAIQGVFRAGFLPCALEVADAFTLAAARRRTGSVRLDGCGGHVIVELDGQERSVRAELRAVEAVLAGHHPRFVERANGALACEGLWQLRREFSYALRDTGLTKLNEDIAVPRGRLEELLGFTERLQRRHGFPIACFGHAGDGNIHVNVMVDREQAGADERSRAVLDALFSQVLAWGGVITGEHGIGLAKKPWWEQAIPPEVRRLHAVVKKALDPRGILNPGKFV